MSRVLIVDDEASICWAFGEYLGDLGHEVAVASTAEEGLEAARQGPFDAVVLDVRLPGLDGLSAMSAFRDRLGAAPIVIITAFGSLDTAVRAMEAGAFDYLVKPFDLDQAGAVVQRALESGGAAIGGAKGGHVGPGPGLVGSSPPMQALFKQIALVAATDVPVLITGESGTGKELVARAIHQNSPRRSRTFLPVCLAALSPGLVEGELFGHMRGSFTGASQDRKGLLELAAGGTVLLDEIGDVPLGMQVKLLRAIEHREVAPVGDARPRPIDVRFLAATNRPLPRLMADGLFREDLFFRLSVFPIHIPPLRDRLGDVPELARFFLKQVDPHQDGAAALRDDTLAELVRRPWVGNVRELRNAIERAAIVARGGPILPEHLPAAIASPGPDGAGGDGLDASIARWTEAALDAAPDESDSLYDRFLAQVEPPMLRAVLRRESNNKALASQRIGIHRSTLRQKLRKYGLE
ncbi:sigma-54-dependent transcriptional regulator [Planctomyces sp. SH-PL62]|uniref:sigma-54-dependent transcriptional regulator n=1 Tax=Planctomyces sp. SH-PL62 TaxID=1636152 RepID=UPI00078D8982|nr:sigma-54 dependent transcriptional regulator [Planctomyces sp. SH-PL62]AMV37110.1 Transcriptional regulatory protein ZraR [Planctomyces sp. SH-PL62]